MGGAHAEVAIATLIRDNLNQTRRGRRNERDVPRLYINLMNNRTIVQPIISSCQNRTDDRIVGKRFQNDGRFVSDEDSNQLQTLEGRKALRLGLDPLDQKSMLS